MTKKYLIPLLFIFGFCAHSQQLTQGPPPPLGCNPYSALDADNDGYTQFDIAWLATVYTPGFVLYHYGYDLSGYQVEYHDANSNAVIDVPYYTNAYLSQQIVATLTYVGPGPDYLNDPNFISACSLCMTLTPLTNEGDYDGDGISNGDEDLNGNGNFSDDDTDGNWFANYLEPNALHRNDFLAGLSSLTPNPASHSINITASNTLEYSLYIYDISGQSVLQITNSHLKVVNISHLNNGIYLVKMTQGTAQFYQKLIKQ